MTTITDRIVAIAKACKGANGSVSAIHGMSLELTALFEAEREACAEVADAYDQGPSDGSDMGSVMAGQVSLAQSIAAGIRARSGLSAPSVIVRCEGCGSSWTNADLRAERAKNPRCVSCCPERNALKIDEWRYRAIAAQDENERLRAAMQTAEPFVELLHSLTGETRARQIVWKALQQIRAALSSSAPEQEGQS